MNILLVEDNDSHAYIFRRHLESLGKGHHLETVNDGTQADRRLGDDNGAVIDVVFLDLCLPGMGGLELLAKWKQDARLRNVPFVTLTSSDLDAEREEALRLGVVKHCVKPLHAADMDLILSTLGAEEAR